LVYPYQVEGREERPLLAGWAGQGHSHYKGQDDQDWDHHDQLPAAGGASKLLPLHHLQPGPDWVGYRLHVGRVGQTWERPLEKKRQPMNCGVELFLTEFTAEDNIIRGR